MNNNLNDGGPAFPRRTDISRTEDGEWETVLGNKGMSLRDYFAAAAFQAIISKAPLIDQRGEFGKLVQDKIQYNRDISESAYWMADAMIEAREGTLDLPSEDYLLEALEIAEDELSRANGYLLQRIKEKENVIGWQNDTQRTLKLVRNAIKKYKNQTF